MEILLFVASLGALIVGAELLVRGASRLAVLLGLSPLVIGLTVVAFGTSAPELAVSFNAARADQAGIALGNVVGSNIFNVLFILGVSALIVPLIVAQQLIRFDVPLMIGLSLLVYLFALDGGLGRVDGAVLLLGLLGYVAFLIIQSRRQRPAVADATPTSPVTNNLPVDLLMVAGGLALLVLGSRGLVDSAVAFAEYLGVSEIVIGLTIVAAGTSLPEVVTSIVAALRKERDIAVGNVVGSNIFNLMGVLGVACLASPGAIEVSPAVLGLDLPVMILVAFACLPVFFTGGIINRTEGALFLLYYVAYTVYLILAATQHDALPRFSLVLVYFALPITLLTLTVLALRQWRQPRN